MKRTLCQLIRLYLGKNTMTLNELAALITPERRVRKDSIRGQLRGLINKGQAESRRGACGVLRYRMLTNVTALGGNQRINEFDQLLSTARHATSAEAQP